MISVNRLYERVAGERRFRRGELFLMLSLIVIAFVPAINDIIISRIAYGGSVIDIIGQLEWFDTLNETILAFLVLPMYNLLNSVRSDRGRLGNRISQMTVVGFCIYLVFSAIVLISASMLADAMHAELESVAYLRLMTVGFVFDYLVQISMVVLVVLGRARHVTMLVISKVAILAIADMILMVQYSFMGAALAAVVCNIVMVLVCYLILRKERLLSLRPTFDKVTFMQWVKVGRFSGGETFLNNLVYIIMVCAMVNAVGESGNYWVANNFIWGWLLVPISALAEIVRRDYEDGNGRLRMYGLVLATVFLIWTLMAPAWGFIYSEVFGATDPYVVTDITYKLVPFYIAYGVSAVIDAVFLSTGRTGNTFLIAIIVNVVYYGIVYTAFSANMITPSMDFIILMFGFGMVVHVAMSVILFIKYRKDGVRAVGVETTS